MTTIESDNIAFIRDYFAALQDGATGDALARFYTADAVQIELPNRLNPKGGRSDLPTLLQRAELAPQLLRSQKFEILSETAQDDRVVVEAFWSAVLAVPVGTLAAGDEMKAHFAIFFEFSGGRIQKQRNYDCFEAW